MHKHAFAIVGSMATGVALLVAGLTIALVVPAAGAAAPRLPKIDLSTDAAVHSYLRSIGVDPATVVIQRGLNNYAGPSCPGLLWNCTTATRVVQVAPLGGSNRFDFVDPAFGLVPPFPLLRSMSGPQSMAIASTNPCVIVQSTASGQNHARCFLHSSANPETLTAQVTQENVNGDNFFQGHQRIQQKRDAEQLGAIELDLRQSNRTGNNHAQSLMQIFQSTSEVTGGTTPMQTQNGTFDADPWVQETETGNNFGHLTQELKQDGTAKGSDTNTVQHQFSDEQGDIDQFAESFGEGLSQASSGQGFSNLTAHQSETQSLTGPGTQIQEGPQGCCGFGTQTGDPQQTSMNINQDSSQHASRGTAEQTQTTIGECDSTGSCSITHHVGNDEDSITSSTDGSTLFTTCESSDVGGGEGSGQCFSSEGGS